LLSTDFLRGRGLILAGKGRQPGSAPPVFLPGDLRYAVRFLLDLTGQMLCLDRGIIL